MIDPLLPSTKMTETTTPRTPQKKTRRPGVANSAKILATGLATTATLGLTTGYALASKTQPQQVPTQTEPQSVPTAVTPNSVTPNSPAPPVASAPNASTQQATTPVVTAPPVVEITVPTIAPAQPGTNWGNSGGNQTSNGSN